MVKRETLSEGELAEIRKLFETVKARDGICLKMNWDMLSDRKPGAVHDLLYYADGRLVAFLGIFKLIPTEAELSGMVHPDYRRQRIFTEMTDEAVGLQRGGETVIYICPRESASGSAFLRHTVLPVKSEYLRTGKRLSSTGSA